MLVAFGYAGWGAGQLESELAQRAWFTAPEDPKLIFDEDRDKLWDHALAHRTQDL
jgi:putative transcriptional regulator